MFLVGMRSDRITLGNSSAVKCTLVIGPRNPTLRHLPKGNEDVCPNKDLHVNFSS